MPLQHDGYPDLEALVGQIATRLQRSCAHMAPEDFDRIVRDIADMKIRFMEIEAASGDHVDVPPRPARPPRREDARA